MTDNECTPMADRACPVHGDCTCPLPDCPLHGLESDHPRLSSRYMAELIQRLRGVYVGAVNDGAGLLNGSDTYTSTFDVPPIHREAALAIERLVDQLEAAEE